MCFKMFTKKHFEALAKLIKESDANSKYQIAQDMAKLFSEDNDRFNVSKFYKACGIILVESESPETIKQKCESIEMMMFEEENHKALKKVLGCA